MLPLVGRDIEASECFLRKTTRVPQGIKSYFKGNTKRGAESEGNWLRPQHCRDQSAECNRLMEKAQSKDEAQVLTNISQSWLRVAGQIDRYHAIMREKGRIVRKWGRRCASGKKPPLGAGSCGGFSPVRNHSCVHIAVSSQAQDHRPIQGCCRMMNVPLGDARDF